MSVQNVTEADLALIDLLNEGQTREPLELHLAAGYAERDLNGKYVLTASGRRRAESLRDSEQQLRTMKTNRITGSAIRAVKGCGFTGAPCGRRAS
jgi:hypothetical protein